MDSCKSFTRLVEGPYYRHCVTYTNWNKPNISGLYRNNLKTIKKNDYKTLVKKKKNYYIRVKIFWKTTVTVSLPNIF